MKDYALPRFAYSVALQLVKEVMTRDVELPSQFVSEIDRLSKVTGHTLH